MSEAKPSVLIIGGLGYIGRWLAYHLYTNKLASEVRIVDKQLPELSWLAPELKDACSNFVQADMSRAEKAAKVFERDDGSSWDYVFNCAGETRYAQDDDMYKQRNYHLPIVCGKEAARRGVKLFVEVGDGKVYKPNRSKSKETDDLKPWLPLAKYKLQAEEELRKIEGLNLVILRLANVYGPYSSSSISTLTCMARVYQSSDEPMTLLWTNDLRINTVHVSDVSKAIWSAAEWFIAGKTGWKQEWGNVPTFNVVDDGDTSQGTLAEAITEYFKIDVNFLGTVVSQLARMNIDETVEEANGEVLQQWAQLLEDAGIDRPGPISPYIETEQLKDSDLSLDGTRFKEVTGFAYEIPKLTPKYIEELVDSYKTMHWWPST